MIPKGPLTRIRLGLVALALSGLMFAIGILLRGEVDMAKPEVFIRGAASPMFVPAWTIILAGVVLNLHGTFGLYRYLTYKAESLIAFLALVLRVTGIALVLPLFGFFPVSVPVIADLYQQGNLGVIAVVEANLTRGLGIVVLGIGGMASMIGVTLFGIAIWRHGKLPKWTGVLFPLSLPLLAFPLTFATELLGAILLLVSAAAVARKAWEESVGKAGTA